MPLSADQIETLRQTKVSAHFTAFEVVRSREHPLLMEQPHPVIMSDCKKFAEEVLEPYRELCCENKPVGVNSWYRNPKLNKAVGGEHNSVHQVFLPDNKIILGLFRGVAVDTVPSCSIYDVFRRTADVDIPELKTVILYPLRGFIHIDSNVTRQERAWMVSLRAKTYTHVPQEWVSRIEEFLREKCDFEVKT